MKPHVEIEKLRARGLAVRVVHLRRPGKFWGANPEEADFLTVLVPNQERTATVRQWRAAGVDPHSKGGATLVSIVREDGHEVASAEARVSPRDHFNRRLGLTIALGRCLDQLEPF